MESNKFMQHLKSLNACDDAKEWANGKSWQEVYDTCHRGDWLLWLYRRSKSYDLQKLTLAKGFCANTVRHLMRDERSLKAVDTAIAFGKGEINIGKLNAAAADAYAAAYAAAAAAAAYAAATADAADAYADATAATAATAAATAAAYAASTADAAAAAYARKENQQKTADIVREVLPFEIWEL